MSSLINCTHHQKTSSRWQYGGGWNGRDM